MVHVMSLVAVGVAVGLYAVMGVLAFTTGRAAPWRREDVLRPRLWGSGALVFGAGLGLARFAGALHRRPVGDAVFACSMLMLLSGVVLQQAGQRTARRRG